MQKRLYQSRHPFDDIHANTPILRYRRDPANAQFIDSVLNSKKESHNGNQVHMPLILAFCVSPLILFGKQRHCYQTRSSAATVFAVSKNCTDYPRVLVIDA